MSARIGTVTLRLQSFLLLTESAAESIEFISKYGNIREAAQDIFKKRNGKVSRSLALLDKEQNLSNQTLLEQHVYLWVT